MARHSWVLAALVMATAPVACAIELAGPTGPGGSGEPSGTGASGFGGSEATGGETGSGGDDIGADQCNPVTGVGCPADGSTCDLDVGSGHFACFPPPNTIDVCGACDDSTTFCGSDLTCVLPSQASTGVCYRYCCTDADCGAGGICDTAFAASVLTITSSSDTVGLCVTSATDESPACGPPATSPSGGSCVGDYSGSPDGGTDAGPPPPPQDGGPTEDGSAPPPEDGGEPFGDGGHAGRHDGGPHGGGE
jgi:hypothetical protein